MRSLGSRRDGRAWTGWALAAAALLVAFVLRDGLARFPRGLHTDDAYFYAKIATNLARDGVSSFDGLQITDGYHLLWTWLLAGVSWLTGLLTADPGHHLSAMLTAYLGLAVWISIRFGRTPARMVVLFLISVVFKMLMETTLLALFLLVLSRELLWRPRAERGVPWRLVLAAFLVPLVRIDALFMPMLLAVGALLARGDHRSGPFVAAASALGGVVQLAANHAIAGHWVSVSAEIKAGAPLAIGTNLAANLTGHYLGGLAAFGVFAAAAAFALDCSRRCRLRDERIAAYAALSTATLFILPHLLFNCCMRYWYYVPALYLLLQAAFELERGRQTITRIIAVVMVVGLVGKYTADTHLRSNEIEHSRQFVHEVAKRVPAEARVFQIDGTGFTGFFSQRHVINGDGLVHTHAFAKRLRRNELSGYLAENDIQYIIHSTYPADRLLMSHHGLVVRAEQVETLVAPPPGLAKHTAFGLYRLVRP